MVKKVLGILALTSILFSCGNFTEKKETIAENEIATITVDKIMTDLQSYVDKSIVIEGTVNHVCSHGGKRMFIMGEDPEVAIKITPNEKIGVFEKELEGSFVIVSGILKELRIDENYVVSLEKEGEDGAKNEAMHDHSAGTHDEEAENEQKAQFEAMRTQIAESENGYYSQYWIEASKFEEKEIIFEEEENIEGEENEPVHSEGEESEGHDHDNDHEHTEGDGHSH